MENLYELLEEAAHKVPTKGIVIVNNSQCDLFLTYSELREKSRKIAFILKSYYQVKPVSKIIISVEKSENFILLFWGCVMAGCIPVLMPSVQFSNKNSIAFERLKNAIDILGVVTLITNDINLFEYYKSSFHKAVCVEDIMYSYSCYIAYDICKRFEQENIPIQGIIMIGGTPPTLRDDLMQFFSNDDNALLDYSRAKDLLNEELIATLSDEEKHEYLHELRMNTVAMVNYKFLDCKLKTPLCSIVGREDEPTIRNNQHLWNNYFQKVSFHQLPGGHVLITKYHAELAKLIMNYIELHV